MIADGSHSIRWSVALVLLAPAAAPMAGEDVPAKSPDAAEQAPPKEWTAKQDHQDMMYQLGIKTLRRGADGMNRQAPNFQNTDESKADPWTNLPDPLCSKNGQKVTSADAWWKGRRHEIVEEFDREVYGRVPKNVPKVSWSTNSENCRMARKFRTDTGQASNPPAVHQAVRRGRPF